MLKRFLNQMFHWELWHFNVIYAPLGFVWMYYVLKARTFWYFSNVNPTLLFSGFEGESKHEMYEQLPAELYPTTIYISPHENLAQIIGKIKEANILFPLVAKPVVGTQGLMFRRLSNEDELQQYHRHSEGDYLIQSFVDLPEEYSVFYIHYPNEEKGKITGLILKDYLSVTGNGTATLSSLIQKDNRAKYRWEEMRVKHKEHLHEIIPAGEKYTLSIAGNHNRGARFINLYKEIDDQLCAVFDNISKIVPQFHYGRYDLKCTSLADLKQGKNIQILEYNGTGAEPNHIYDCGMSYKSALKVIAQHWKDMYNIGRINYKQGIPYWSFWQGRKHLRKAYKWYNTLRKADIKLHL